MPLYMDVHSLDGAVTFEDVGKAHQADLKTQGSYDVSYLRYWVDRNTARSFPVEAPDADAAATVHREAHGLVAEEIYEVQEGSWSVSAPRRSRRLRRREGLPLDNPFRRFGAVRRGWRS